MSTDAAGAYEKFARQFLQARDRASIGAAIVRRWARLLCAGTEVLEIGCGGGFPVTRELAAAGLKIWAVDSSPALLSVFKTRFPEIPVDCARALESTFFAREFGAVISVGLLFLLNAEEQTKLIRRVAGHLPPGGRFLFSAPVETGTWSDVTTGQQCRSLGRERYGRVLAEAGFRLVATYRDEGRNNHYDAERTEAPRVDV